MASKYHTDLCDELLTHMGKGHSFYSFSALADVGRDTLLKWADVHPEFDEARKLGIGKALYYWETVMNECATARIKMNATMIMFKLRNSFQLTGLRLG